jgi:hypothetical protein
MDGEYPGNSRRVRETAKPEPTEDKKIDKVIDTTVVRRKKSLGKRFVELFVVGDAKSVMSYVFLDVMMPAAKDMFADMASTTVERMIFGESRTSNRRPGTHARSTGTPGYVSYNRYATASRDREESRSGLSRKARATHDFDEIIISSRAEAEEVIDRLFDLVAKYQSATVADLYGLIGETPAFTDEKWGWIDIQGAGVRRAHGGYLLDLPKPVPLLD